ncbi:MAG: hypothetical protein R2745_17325 [Vicinamibacterales bacterium]
MSRQFIFRHYWWIAIVAGLASIATVLKVTDDGRVALVGSVVAGLLGFCYFAQTQKLQEMALFKELFTEFNRRYDELNDRLAKIAVAGTANPDSRAVIVDYFNLCAEEYLWFSEGYIPRVVWKSWCAGMLAYLYVEPFRTIWDEESATNSYYGLSIEIVKKGAG